MATGNFGDDALTRVQKSLSVEAEWTVEGTHHWSYLGTLQHAWSSQVGTPRRPSWRLHLHTRLLEGFTGAEDQMTALNTCLPYASLAAVVSQHKRPGTLELASTVDVHEGNVGTMVRLLTVAARAQVAEARSLVGCLKKLAHVGLSPDANMSFDAPCSMLSAGRLMIRESAAQKTGHLWSQREIATCVETLKRFNDVRAVKTAWGMSATFTTGDTGPRSILEISADGGRPQLGTGIAISLWTPVRGGPRDALRWNEREFASAADECHAFGGWWAQAGGFLIHRSFYPVGVCNQDLVSQFLMAYARRACQANQLATQYS